MAIFPRRIIMLQNLNFGYYVLASYPIWHIAFALIIFGCVSVYAVRAIFEGFAYNVSWCSICGNPALIVVVLIGATVIQREGVPSEYFRSMAFHLWCGLISIAAGLVLLAKVRIQQGWLGEWLDMFNNGIFVPVMLYVILIIVPIISKYGTKNEIKYTQFLLSLWVILLFFDGLTGRLDQRPWMERHLGIVPPKSRRKKK
jgi:hypothetical protein